jgi:hypothetical protein
MSFVVTAFSWAGWIWTGLFFLAVIPLLLMHRGEAAGAATRQATPDGHGTENG